ncbi:MAG: hypothetical protein HYR64_10060 [Fimbriimonas ginsengisoli]|uniref:Uncharacterized protein n=1 Tax=Fimbriimonas ginsengisoli TaxID=1005039 RepID=A0A931PVA7_FIMGI|nr:hypothetical protein [Fimbriimonas ginsengisoli]
MNYPRIAIALSFAVALVLAACGPALETKLVGKWKGDLKLTKEQASNPGFQALIGLLSLNLAADKTFKMDMGAPMEGKWALDGKQIKLTMLKMGGKSVDEIKSGLAKAGKAKEAEDFSKPLVLNLSDDATELTIAPEQAKQMGPLSSMSFKKQAGGS